MGKPLNGTIQLRHALPRCARVGSLYGGCFILELDRRAPSSAGRRKLPKSRSTNGDTRCGCSTKTAS
jgi:hypothetical protein